MTILWYQEPVAVLSTGQRATKSWRSRLPWSCPSSTPTSSSWKRSCRKWTVLWRSTSMTSEWATGPAVCPSVHSFGCWGVGGGGVKGVLWRRGDVITSQRPALQTCLSGKTVLSLLSVCLSSSLTLAHILSAVLLVSLCLFLPPLSSPLPPPIPSSHSVYTSSPTPHPLCTLPPYLCVCVMPLPLSLSVSVTLCASPSSLSLPPPPSPYLKTVYLSVLVACLCIPLFPLSMLTFPTTCLPLSVCLSVCTSLPSHCLPSLPPVYLYLSVCLCVPLCPLIAYLPYHLSTSICLSVCVYLSALLLLTFPTTCPPLSVCLYASVCAYISASSLRTLPTTCLPLCMCIPLRPLSACLPYHLSTSVCLSTCLCVPLPLCLPSCLPLCLSCLSVYTFSPSLCLPSLPPAYFCLSVCLSVYTSPSLLLLQAYLHLCLPPAHLSVCLPLCV